MAHDAEVPEVCEAGPEGAWVGGEGVKVAVVEGGGEEVEEEDEEQGERKGLEGGGEVEGREGRREEHVFF